MRILRGQKGCEIDTDSIETSRYGDRDDGRKYYLSSKEERGVLNTERDRGPASWPYLGTRAPQLAEPVGRTLRSGVFDVAGNVEHSECSCKNSQVALGFVFFLRPSAVSLILC